LIQLGIPLNIVMGPNNEKNNNNNILNIKKLFGITDIDWSNDNGITNKNGQVFKINTSFMKGSFEDFRESYRDSDKIFQDILDNFNLDEIFNEQTIVVFEQDLSFCDGNVKSKIFKVIKVTDAAKMKENKKRLAELGNKGIKVDEGNDSDNVAFESGVAKNEKPDSKKKSSNKELGFKRSQSNLYFYFTQYFIIIYKYILIIIFSYCD